MIPVEVPFPNERPKEGLYDQLVTRHVREFLDRQATHGLKSSVEAIEENDYPDYLARHLIRQIKAALRGLPAEDRKRRQSDLANSLLDLMGAGEDSAEQDSVDQPGQVLRAIYSGADHPSAIHAAQRYKPVDELAG